MRSMTLRPVSRTWGVVYSSSGVGAAQGQDAHEVVAPVLLHLGHDLAAVHRYLHGVVDGRQLVAGELHVHHRTDDLHNPSLSHGFSPIRPPLRPSHPPSAFLSVLPDR